MPYILSPQISANSPGMWFEGAAYEKRSIYSIEPGKMPPVNYDEHIIRSHSLTHVETPAHTMKGGRTLESYYTNNFEHFYGLTAVLKLKGNNYESIGSGNSHWVITTEEIKNSLRSINYNKKIAKVLITTEFYPVNEQGFHDPRYVLTLSQEAADYLISDPNFNMYGTSWKSSDYNPGKPERPIHNTIFKQALILENLNLKEVPEGIYFMNAFPLPFRDASESPVVPVLFTKEELSNIF